MKEKDCQPTKLFFINEDEIKTTLGKHKIIQQWRNKRIKKDIDIWTTNNQMREIISNFSTIALNINGLYSSLKIRD